MGVPKAEGNVDAIIMRMPDRNSGACVRSQMSWWQSLKMTYGAEIRADIRWLEKY
jgi:hypothetical protein